MARAAGRERVAMAAALVVLACSGVAHGGGGLPPGYDRDPEAVVLRYREVLGELAESDAGPTLDVHGDGRCVVHYPRYMKRAGDWQLRLSRAELDDLLATMVERGLLHFDAGAVARERRAFAALRRARGQLTYSSDPSVVEIELRVNGGGGTVRWAGLRSDVADFPDIGALQDLAAARTRLQAILERQDLSPLGGGVPR